VVFQQTEIELLFYLQAARFLEKKGALMFSIFLRFSCRGFKIRMLPDLFFEFVAVNDKTRYALACTFLKRQCSAEFNIRQRTNSVGRALLEELTVVQFVSRVQAFDARRKCVAMLTHISSGVFESSHIAVYYVLRLILILFNSEGEPQVF
jgi:hypothetical protein